MRTGVPLICVKHSHRELLLIVWLLFKTPITTDTETHGIFVEEMLAFPTAQPIHRDCLHTILNHVHCAYTNVCLWTVTGAKIRHKNQRVFCRPFFHDWWNMHTQHKKHLFWRPIETGTNFIVWHFLKYVVWKVIRHFNNNTEWRLNNYSKCLAYIHSFFVGNIHSW